jgi:2-polyprenyl-6-methoxyphenol hydroxylase-like FAD-dependent oxidoreductase
MKTDVLIVGAGPTGLALAVQLIRYGIDFVIIDKKETTTPYSKAIGVQARTLEIYDQIGLAENLVSRGWVANKVRLVEGGEIRGQIDLDEFGKGMSPFPFLLILEQGKHESILYDFIRSNGRDVRWQAELLKFTQDENGVTAEIKNASGEYDTIEASYLVGCDGAHSLVRHSLGIDFGGSTFERIFYVADVELDWAYEHDALHANLGKNTLTAFFPMSGEKQWRVVGTFPEGHKADEGEVLFDEIEKQVYADTDLKFDITKVNWFSTYKVHSRHVSKFSDGRCFLAGDSAHIHTPAGAQGMNTGIQDGYNLAWKLALALKNDADAKLLDTYNEERLPNAHRLLQTTDRFFALAASEEPVTAFFRQHIFPYIANFALNIDAVKRIVFPLVSQIGINYRQSSLSVGDEFKVKAGDRMPYFAADGASIYDRLREPKFHLVAFYDGKTESALPDELTQKWSGLIDSTTISLYPHIGETFGASQSFYVILRPDNYIGLISSNFSTEAIQGYFEKFMAEDKMLAA